MTSEKVEDIFSRLLTAMWLRPERALYDAHILSKVSKLITPYLESNSLEFGCLDGVPTFAMLGGVFSDGFDDYFGMTRADNVSASIEKIDTSQVQASPNDYFETFLESTALPIIATPAKSSFNFGVSHKLSHINRSERLGIYGKLWAQSLSEPLPLDEGSLGLIYAPMLFWVPERDLPSTIRELCRCSRVDGRLITTFPKEDYADHLLLSRVPNATTDWKRAIDGGSSERLCANNLGRDDLQMLFRDCGYVTEVIEEAIPIRVAQVYEIGFRAMFPVFLKMRSQLIQLKGDSLLEIKKHWISTVKDFLDPLCRESNLDERGRARTWHVLSLKKI